MKTDVPLFILGEGSNILVSDRGIRGVVVDTSGLNGIEDGDGIVAAEAGAAMAAVVEYAHNRSLSGLEPFHKMPGTVGGAVWMNARCYGSSISDVLHYVDYVDASLQIRRLSVSAGAFGYKRSPFQDKDWVITGAGFRVQPGSHVEMREQMNRIEADRTAKGHFLFRSAGSAFKNNRSFGKPTGQIVDSLGLKGFGIGGARISLRHANIIINTGTATATDVLRLMQYVENRVRQALGFDLEREVLLVGDWSHER